MTHSSNKKRKIIMETGRELFWKYGFKRVTIEEICAAAGVSKMTYYKFFSNKMDLVKLLLNNTVTEAVDKYKTVMDSDIPFQEKVELQIKMKMEGTSDISKEFMDDLLVHADPEAMQMMNDISASTLRMIFDDYVTAQQEGHIRKDIKPEFILYFLNHMFEMMEDEKLANMYETASDLATEMIRFFFYGILSPEEKQ